MMRLKAQKKAVLIRNKITFPVLAAALLFLMISFLFESQAVLSWWFAILLLLPPVLISLRTQFVALKAICITIFLVQTLTLPFFYLNKNSFNHASIKPFSFTSNEAMHILVKVSLFLICLLFFFVFVKHKPSNLNSNLSHSLTRQSRSIGALKSKMYPKPIGGGVRSGDIYSQIILIIIAVLVPINLWSYSRGIGLTGIEPPRLPFRISGILFYTTKYITPILFGFLLSKSRRTWGVMFVLLSYSWILGLSSISKGSVLMVIGPVIWLALKDRRTAMVIVASLGAVFGILFAAGAREFVYRTDSGVALANTSLNIFELIWFQIENINREVGLFEKLLETFVGIFNRIDGFSNLVMSEYYDSDAVNGVGSMILRMIWFRLALIDVDAHHLQWQGYTLPDGFYSGGGLLSNVVIIGNSALSLIPLVAFITFIYIFILESSIDRLSGKIRFVNQIKSEVKIFFTVVYVAEGAGTLIIVVPLILVFILSHTIKVEGDSVIQRSLS